MERPFDATGCPRTARVGGCRATVKAPVAATSLDSLLCARLWLRTAVVGGIGSL